MVQARLAVGAHGFRVETPLPGEESEEFPAVKMENPVQAGRSRRLKTVADALPEQPQEQQQEQEQQQQQQAAATMGKQSRLSFGQGTSTDASISDPTGANASTKGPVATGGDFGKVRKSRPRRASARILKTKKRIRARRSDYKNIRNMYRAVWEGRFKKTHTGLTVDDLCANVRGRIVPKRLSAHCKMLAAKNGWAQHWRTWCLATKHARDAMGIKGFVKTKKEGSELEVGFYSRILINYTNATLLKNGSKRRIVFEEDASPGKQNRVAQAIVAAASEKSV